MPLDFPSFQLTGVRPSRFYAAPADWKSSTDSFEFQDGGKTFNEVADHAPLRWEYGFTGLSPDQAQVYDDFFNSVRYSQPFNFEDKYGTTWLNVRIEEYDRNHDAHKSWVMSVFFRLVSYTGEFLDVTPPSVPAGLEATSVGSTSVTLAWDAATD